MFGENKKAPEETLIRVSTVRHYFVTFIRLLVSALFIYGAFTVTTAFGIIFYSLLAIIIIYFTISEYKEASKEPDVLLKINSKGIYVKKRYIPLSQVEKFTFEDISMRTFFAGQYLVVHTISGGENRIDISNIATSSQKLSYLLNIYKERSFKIAAKKEIS